MKRKLVILLLSIVMAICLAFGLSACGIFGDGTGGSENQTVSVTSVTLDKSSLDLSVGESYTLSATISPSNATNQNVTWSSSTTSIATVSNGEVTAVSEGMAIITVTTTDGGYTDTCSVTVTETQNTPSTVSVTSVSLSETSLSLEAGGTYTLTATVLPNDATDKTVSWSSSDESVATVNNGIITAVAAGTATITVTTTDGNYTATCEYCSVCGVEISRETITIPATGHTNAEAVIENEVAATCAENGSYDLVIYCSVCGVEISRETIIIPATGHNYESVVTAPTCTEPGYTTHTCSVCGDSYTDNETEALGHNYELSSWMWNGYTTAAATFICANDKSHTESIAATITDEITTSPTCTETGIKTYTATVTFDGKTYSNTTTEVIAATGHTEAEAVTENYVAATCTADGSYDLVVYCSVCGAELSRETIIIPATGHSYESVVTAPTCTEDGYTTYTCSVCGDIYTDNYVDATGHSWNEGEVTTEPTCTEEGVKTYTCTVCGETKTETITSTGHTEGEAVTENYVAATCTEDGSYDLVVYCTVCGEELSRETIIINALGHTWNEGEIITEPTCTEEGIKTYTCTVCCNTYTEAIAMIAHSYNEDAITIAVTGLIMYYI